MSRKKRTPEENARRAKIGELLQEANISSMADIQSLFRKPSQNSWRTGWKQSWTKNSVTANMISATRKQTTPGMVTAARG